MSSRTPVKKVPIHLQVRLHQHFHVNGIYLQHMSIMVWWIWSINYNALWSWRLWRSEIDIFNFIHWYHNCVVLVLTGIFDHNTEILSLLWHSFSAAVKLFQNSVYVIYGLHPKPVMCIAMHSLVWCEVLQVYLQVSFHSLCLWHLVSCNRWMY